MKKFKILSKMKIGSKINHMKKEKKRKKDKLNEAYLQIDLLLKKINQIKIQKNQKIIMNKMMNIQNLIRK